MEDFVEGKDHIAFARNYVLDPAQTDVYAFIGNKAFEGEVGAIRYLAIGADTQVQVDLDGDRVADIAFVLTGTHALQASDFVI